MSAIEIIRSKKQTCRHIESMYQQLIKANASNLEKFWIDEVLSKLVDHSLVSNKKTSAGLGPYWVLAKELVNHQIYFSILDSDKNSLEQLIDD